MRSALVRPTEPAGAVPGLGAASRNPYRISVVIPALNEAENLPHVLPRIPPWIDEVLLVDGNSTDGTIEVARKLYPAIQVVVQEGKGKGAALRSGFAISTGDIIVTLDADGSTNPSEIPAFVGALLAGADFAKGSRFLQGSSTVDMPLYRRIGNQVFVLLVRLLFGGRYSDLCYGYNAFWARVLPELDLACDGFEIETLMNVRALRAGLKVVEVSSFEAKRVYGTGRLRTIPDGWRVLKTIWREWRSSARAKRQPVAKPLPLHPDEPLQLRPEDRAADEFESITPIVRPDTVEQNGATTVTVGCLFPRSTSRDKTT